jgi:hypothetical protein
MEHSGGCIRGQVQYRMTGKPLRLACLALAAVLSAGSGCGTTPSGDFERLEIIVMEPEAELPDGPSKEPSKGETAAAGAAVGAASGLFYSLLGSLACGPAFAACFAAAAPLTVGGTALAGGAMGLAVTGAPEEVAEQIASHLEFVDSPQKLGEEVASALSKQFPASRLAPPGKADARVRLSAEQPRVARGLGGRFGFSLIVNASYDWKLDQAQPTGYGKRYYCQTKGHTAKDWLQGEGDAIGQELNQCIGKLAAQIYDTLKKPPPPGPVGFEGDWN